MATQHIGIREFVELTVRTGDLNPVTANSNNTAALGSKIHRQLQAAHPEADYQKEVFLKQIVTLDSHDYQLEGRADGVLFQAETPYVEEIKTSARPWTDVPANTKDRYWAQARVYAYLLCQREGLDQLEVRLVYVQTNTDTVTRFSETMSATALRDHFDALLAIFQDWLILRSDIVAARNETSQVLTFPFPAFRTGQRELAGAVYKSIYAHTRLFIQAPTGTGKTISTLFPAIKAMGADLIQRVFYLTAKQSTRHVAESAMATMATKGLIAKSITLTAKDQITFEDEPDDPSLNPYMLGYYDRLKPGLTDLLTHENQITRAIIEQYAHKHQLDPFEFSLDASLFCDVIICDYNYLFDPQVMLQRFFSEPDPTNFFLVDEAHNLVDRAREMYSSSLDSAHFDDLAKQLRRQKGGVYTPIKRQLTRVRKAFKVVQEDVLAQAEEMFVAELPEPVLLALSQLATSFHDLLALPPSERDQATVDDVLPLFFDVTHFMRIAELYDETFETKLVRDASGVQVKILCLDPSQFVDASLNKGCGAVLFSATLSPMPYFQQLLGGAANSLTYALPSPFAPHHQAIIVDTGVPTTYQQRATSLPTLISHLGALVQSKPGHYLFFFPSYQYLRDVQAAFAQAYPTLNTITQTNPMTEADRQAFLAAFTTDQEPLIGFAVLGGLFSEGIDLKGNALIGVAIISVGLPGINSETDRLKKYFDAKNGNGFAYAYQLPGFNNVLQAGGRVIRGAHDVGVILLIDPRYVQPRYAALFPSHWSHAQVSHTTAELTAKLTTFWEEHDENRTDD